MSKEYADVIELLMTAATAKALVAKGLLTHDEIEAQLVHLVPADDAASRELKQTARKAIRKL